MSVKSVLVLGSGPIKIGQAAEFDYSGSQACKALREEGCRVILLNSNPATIQTDVTMADVIYIKPMNAETISLIVKEHRPEGVIATLGGQAALNLCVECEEKGIWRDAGVEVLGTPVKAIRAAEGRESFRDLMCKIGQPVPFSASVRCAEEALEFARRCSYPIIVRPDFTLGGTGSGVAWNEAELKERVEEGLEASPVHKILMEEYLTGWREFELEVVRDGAGNAICICGMENVDPMGIHTGDSVVVSPVLTLTDRQWQRLRSAAFAIVEALDVRGACNVQFAQAPKGDAYYVIEVNPRASRSSALASKATGYPIARMAAKIALGRRLTELPNPTTGVGSAMSEPSLDYVVVKLPYWSFEKFPGADVRLGTRMKSTGEVMAIGLTFPQALLKAFRSLDAPSPLTDRYFKTLPSEDLWKECSLPTHRRMGAMLELLRRGALCEELSRATAIHPYFIGELEEIVSIEEQLKKGLSPDVLEKAKLSGFSDEDIAGLCGRSEEVVRVSRCASGLEIAHREVDSCAGEVPASSGYFYGVYGASGDPFDSSDSPAVAVLGSGPIRIAQGVEFDYCCVKAVESLRRRGLRAVMINNNPETVSTDYDISDALYFEPLHAEDVTAALERERATGIFCSFGGQTSLKLGIRLAQKGLCLLGTSVSAIEAAEDRGQFCELLEELAISYPEGDAVRSPEEARALAKKIGFPLMVRPSFVIGGVDMQVVYDEEELEEVMTRVFAHAPGGSVLIDRFLQGREFEVDAVCDGEDVLIPGIFEHLDPAGVHSGDSIALFPDISLTSKERREIVGIVTALSEALDARGLLNVQFVLHDGKLYVIEANPRASRTVPIASKISGIPMVDLAVGTALGERLEGAGFGLGLIEHRGPVGVKVPVFSTDKLPGVDSRLGPQMQSTGESLGVGQTFSAALCEALSGAGWRIPKRGSILFSVRDDQKPFLPPIASAFCAMGWKLLATSGTAELLSRWGLPVEAIPKGEVLISSIANRAYDVIVNIPGSRLGAVKDGYAMRRTAVEAAIPCFHSLEVAQALASALTAADMSAMLVP